MYKKIIFAVLALAVLFPKFSQAQSRCNFDHEHNTKLDDPEYRDFLKQVRSEIKRLKGDDARINCTNGTYTFPVAIHYNWTGIGTTVDQCMIDAATNSIAALNDDYLGQNADLDDYDALTTACAATYPLSAKSTGSCIEFCIAQYDHPACSELCDGDLAITAGKFAYPNTGGCYADYINIFVQSGTGQLGVAPLYGVTILGGNGPQVDAATWGGPGVLCTPSGLATSFNSNTSYNLGRTLTHEMGHYFGLEHVFVGGCGDDDGFADTPVQSDENFGTPAVVSCNINDPGNTALNTCSTLDMWCSFMDYSNDTHLFMFTTDQSTEMYSSAQMSPIADSAIKCNGAPAVPTAAISLPEIPVFCTSDNAPYSFDFNDESSRCPTSWAWTFSGAGVSPATSSMEDPTVTVTMSGDVTATLVSTNAQGASSMVTKTVYVNIADANSCPDCGMTFKDSGGSSNNYSNSESYTWTYCADPGEVLEVDLTSINLAVVNSSLNANDILWIKYGSTPPTGLSDTDLIGFGNTLYSTSFAPQPEAFETPGECVSFFFESNGTVTGPGWDATITCKSPPTCDDGVQNQGEEFVDCGGANCPACPSMCGFTFTDPQGDGDIVPANNATTWTVCADETDEILKFDFSVFLASNALATPSLLVYNGSLPSDLNNWDYNYQQGGYFPAGGAYTQENPLVSTGQCMSFYLSVPAATANIPGFEALISCCAQEDLDGCAAANVAGAPFTETVDNYCSDNVLGDITSFQDGKGDSDSRDCTTLSDNQVFYEVTCDGDGGNLTVDIGPNSEGGTVDAAIYGPVTGTCPNYVGGSQVACESGTDPAPMTIAAMPNEVYIVVVASQERGTNDIVGSGTALAMTVPVELISFDAELRGKDVMLLWRTASEVNNDFFTLERSGDGVSYEKIIDIAGQDNAPEGEKYEFLDSRAITGKNYYRLSQTDFDGTHKVIGNASADITSAVSQFTLYPNPSSHNRVTVRGLASESDFTLTMTNTVGENFSQPITTNASGEAIVDLGELSSGVYFITATNGKDSFVTKFIKLR